MKRYFTAAAIAAALTVSTVSANAVSCFQLGSTRAYIYTMFLPDGYGNPDLDYANDYLADVPKRCRYTVAEVGKLIAKEYKAANR